MAGYSGFSRSNSAIEAEERNCFPASKLASMLPGVTSRAIKALMKPAERHHTSSHYNMTDYYDGDDLINGDTPELLKKLKEFSKRKKTIFVYEKADVEWLDWERVGGKFKPIEMKMTGVRIEFKPGGTFFNIVLPGGDVVRKKKIKIFGNRYEARDMNSPFLTKIFGWKEEKK